MSRRLLLLSICYLTELCTLSLFSCTAQQGTPVSGPDLSLPCSQSSTCPASDALVTLLWLWLLPHPSPQDWQLCPKDFLYSWFCAADAPFDHMVSLLGYQCPSWCSIHPPPPPPPRLCLILIWFSRDEAVGGPILWVWSTGVLSNGETRGSSCRIPTIVVTPPWFHSFIAFKSLPAQRDWISRVDFIYLLSLSFQLPKNPLDFPFSTHKQKEYFTHGISRSLTSRKTWQMPKKRWPAAFYSLIGLQ